MILKKFKSKLAGTHYYQPAIDILLSRESPLVCFEFDPSCEHDENAIRVIDAISGALLGYVEREVAEEVAEVDGIPVEIHGTLIVMKNKDIHLEFKCQYEPLPVPTDETMLEQIKYYEDLAIGALQDFVAEIHLPKYSDLLCFDYIGNAERALFILDKNNAVLSDSESIKKQKLIEKLLAGNDGMLNDFSDIIHGALIEYHAPNKTATFFNFPNLNDIDLSCRFFEKTVLFTGFWPEEKAQLPIVCEVLKLTQTASVCQKLDFLICGSNAGPSKMKKADQLNIPIIQAADFIHEITTRRNDGN